MPPSADCPLSWLFLHGFIYVLCSVYERDQLCNLSAMFLFAMTCGWSYRRTVLQKNATSSGDSPHLQQDEERQFLIDPNRCRRALLIVAHPDDECMFFAPIVRRLVRLGVDLSLVSASNGSCFAFYQLPKSAPRMCENDFHSVNVTGKSAEKITF